MASLVASSHFKTVKVTKRSSIKAFVEEKALTFNKGRGFYQLTKPEVIQGYKEVVARKKDDGQIVMGDKVREVLKIPKSAKKFKLDLDEVADFDVFVQSTSVNRVLLAGTDFLYEVEEAEEKKEETPKASGRGGRRGVKRKAEDVGDKPAAKAATGSSTKTTPAEDTDAGDAPSPAKKPKGGAPPPPGGPVEIAFSFDTTGSMYPCLAQVRRKISDTVKRLQKEIPSIRIAVIAHGDYCDASYAYVTKIMDFSTDVTKLCDFVEKVGSTGGGDWEECYELVLNETREKLSWTPGTQRSLVMIGDAIPHEPSYPMNTKKLDWRKEAKQLKDDAGVRVYAVQALNNSASTSFYRSVAQLTDGYHLHLDQFASIVDFMMAICFREHGIDHLEAYEEEVKSRGSGMNRSLHRLFDTLTGRGETTYSGGTDTGGLVAVNSARFQVLDVDERGDIRTFVQKNSLLFKTGRGFYEFTKPEKISDKKEVVLVDKVSGDMYTGPEACRLIGAGGSARVKPTSLDKWRVFVQSTSYNRVLMPNTGFLYEVDPEH